jgi:hypothetical protein
MLIPLEQLNDVFQAELKKQLGETDDSKVRRAYQRGRQPFQEWGENICYFFVQPVDDLINRQTDKVYKGGQLVSRYTRVIGLSLVLYGPAAYDRACRLRLRLSRSSEELAALDLRVIPDIAEPLQVWEEYRGEWWPRVDMALRYNNSVTDEETVPELTGSRIVLLTEAEEREVDL